MSDSTIDYVKPYAIMAQNHKDGLDAIITSIGAGGPGTVTIDQLIAAVYSYLVAEFPNIGADSQGEQTIKALIANAINGYLENGGSSPYLRQLQSVPANTLANKFDRMQDAVTASAVVKGNASRSQMVLAVGEADAAYWANQIATSGSWSPYMSTNPAIDLSNVPYWVDAAMFGAYFDYYQLNATDSNAASSPVITALAGSLVVAAGKVVFGWVPKTSGMSGVAIIEVSEDCSCNGGGSAKIMSGGMSQIGRPISLGRAVNTNWRTPATGATGRDTRDYDLNGKVVCTVLINFYGDGQNWSIGC